MIEDKTIPDVIHERITAELHRTVRRLLTVEGYSVAQVLVVIHAETITQIAGHFGGQVAAFCAQKAAGHVAQLPPFPVQDVGVMQ